MAQTILEMRDVKKSFGPTVALQNIHFKLALGEVHALLGENGAGKSTLIKILGGIYEPDQGEIFINDQKVTIHGVTDAQALGIGIIHQEIVLVPHLSVAQNIFLGREKTKNGLLSKNEMRIEAQKMIDALDIKIDASSPVSKLTIAQQQMIEIIKAVSFNAKILVMDEPTSSLSEDEVQTLFSLIGRLKKQQVSIIYISHRMEELFSLTDRITIIRDGTYVDTKITSETSAEELVHLMVGRNLESFYVRNYNTPGPEVLRVEALTKKGVFSDVSFSVRAGEIVGFSGLVGAGRSEVMMSIFGAEAYDSGSISFKGKPVKFKNVMQAINAGIGLVPEDRKQQGLVLINSVGFNLTLAALKFLMDGILISQHKKNDMTEEYFEKLRIKAASPQIAASSLSGGNQQKIVLSKWLATKPDLLILDEPTRGIDVGAKSEIYALINELAKQGMAIIMVSSELPEIINMCDSVCVMKAGKLVAQIEQDEISQEKIMQYATQAEVNQYE